MAFYNQSVIIEGGIRADQVLYYHLSLVEAIDKKTHLRGAGGLCRGWVFFNMFHCTCSIVVVAK